MRRLENFIELHSKGEISDAEIEESVDGWLGYAMHGNTYRLRKTVIKKINNLI